MAFKTLRQKRINALRDSGFTYKESVELTKLKHKNKPVILISKKATKDLMRSRKQHDKKDGAYAKDFLRKAQEYDTPDYWALYRAIIQPLIDEGILGETPKNAPGKSHKVLKADGTPDRERINEYERERRAKERARLRE